MRPSTEHGPVGAEASRRSAEGARWAVRFIIDEWLELPPEEPTA